MKKKLLRDNIKVSEIILESVDIHESKNGTQLPILGSFKVKGMTVEEVKNQNGRIYKSDVWQQPNSFAKGGKYLDESGNLYPNLLYGSLDHPLDDRSDFRLEEAAIAWYNVSRNDDGSWDGAADILDTAKGKVIKSLLEYAKYRNAIGLLGVSSRALGEATLEETTDGEVESIIAEGFELISFDFVYNPSFATAKVNLAESKKQSLLLTESIKSLAKEDPEHADYYNSVAESIIKEKETVTELEKKNLNEKLNKEIKKPIKGVIKNESPAHEVQHAYSPDETVTVKLFVMTQPDADEDSLEYKRIEKQYWDAFAKYNLTYEPTEDFGFGHEQGIIVTGLSSDIVRYINSIFGKDAGESDEEKWNFIFTSMRGNILVDSLKEAVVEEKPKESIVEELVGEKNPKDLEVYIKEVLWRLDAFSEELALVDYNFAVEFITSSFENYQDDIDEFYNGLIASEDSMRAFAKELADKYVESEGANEPVVEEAIITEDDKKDDDKKEKVTLDILKADIDKVIQLINDYLGPIEDAEEEVILSEEPGEPGEPTLDMSEEDMSFASDGELEYLANNLGKK